MCIEIASGVVAALEQSNPGPGAERGHFAPVQHLIALRDEGEGVRWCCDPSAAHGLKLIDEAGRKKCLCCVVPAGRHANLSARSATAA